MIENVGMYWNSIWATSGAPVPAFSAVRSLVYCGSPCPALTTLTSMAGYFFSNRATSFSMFGTQVQKVSSVGVGMALSMSACDTEAAGAVAPVEPAPPAQAVRRRPAVSTVAVARTRRRESPNEADGSMRTPLFRQG